MTPPNDPKQGDLCPRTVHAHPSEVEATIPGDAAGFHPYFISPGVNGGEEGTLPIVNSMILIAGEA